MTRQQIADLISEVSDLAATLRGAESETAAEACRQLGLRLTYHPDKQTVRAAAAPQPGNIGKWLVSEGRMHPNPNACSLVSSQLGADRDRGRGPVDPVDHERLRGTACTHRRNRFLLDPGLYMTHNPRHE